eukprot:553334_1
MGSSRSKESSSNSKQQTQTGQTVQTSPTIPITLELETAVYDNIEEHKTDPTKVIAVPEPVSFEHVATQLGEPLAGAPGSTLQSYYQALLDWGATPAGHLCSDSLLYSKQYGELLRFVKTHKNDPNQDGYNAALKAKMDKLWKDFIWKGKFEHGRYENLNFINIGGELCDQFDAERKAGWNPQEQFILFHRAQKEVISMIGSRQTGIWDSWHESPAYIAWLQTAEGKEWAAAHPNVDAHSDYQDLLLVRPFDYAEFNYNDLPSAHREYGDYYESLGDYIPQRLAYHGSSYNEHNEVNTLSLVVLLVIICIVCIVKDILLCTGCFVVGRAWPLKRKNVEDDHGDLV